MTAREPRTVGHAGPRSGRNLTFGVSAETPFLSFLLAGHWNLTVRTHKLIVEAEFASVLRPVGKSEAPLLAAAPEHWAREAKDFMRPTIPFSAWRIAIDLDATRLIRRQSGHPADECMCADCTMRRRLAPAVFPPELDEQLQRLGIEKDRPTDLYVSFRNEQVLYYRVMFHIAGKILSGPAPWIDGAEAGRMHNYHVVQSEPTWVGLRLSTARDSFEYAPKLVRAAQSDVLCVDFRVQVHRI